MGDMADAFRKIQKPQGWECTKCGGSGMLVQPDESLLDCDRCGSDGIEPGHPLKDDDVDEDGSDNDD